MSDVTIVKEGWVQKRGEYLASPPSRNMPVCTCVCVCVCVCVWGGRGGGRGEWESLCLD